MSMKGNRLIILFKKILRPLCEDIFLLRTVLFKGINLKQYVKRFLILQFKDNLHSRFPFKLKRLVFSVRRPKTGIS